MLDGFDRVIMKKYVSLLIGLALIGAAVGGYWWFAKRPPEVEVTKPVLGPAVEVLYATGVVESKDWAKISPKVSGRIREILADEGNEVVEGQPLMRLDDEEARSLLAQAEAAETYFRDDLDRQQKLAKTGTASRVTLDKAVSDYLQAQAAAGAVRRRVSDLTIVSSKAGVVLRRDGEIGEVVGQNDVLFWIGRLRPIRITAEVDEEDIARVIPGQRVLIKADSFPNQIFEGHVEHVTPMGDTLNKSFRVRIAVPDEVPLMLGMSCEINIVVRESEKSLLIPITALGRDHTHPSVFILGEGNSVRKQVVQVGASSQAMVEILSGLDENSVVLSSPAVTLMDGAKIRPRFPRP